MKQELRALAVGTAAAVAGCASVLDPDGALTVLPYRIDDDGRILVEAMVDDQGPFVFALDTAATISLVFDRLRNELALETVPGERVAVQGAVASGEFPVLTVRRIQVGDEAWLAPRIVSLPAGSDASLGLDGILGADFLRRYAIGFSTEDGALRLFPTTLVQERSYRGWASVPLTPIEVGQSSGLYLLDVNIANQTIPTLFDLGAGLNLLNTAAASLLGLEEAALAPNTALSGAFGRVPIRARIDTDLIETAGIRWRDEVFFVVDAEIFATLDYADKPLGIAGSGLFNQRDFVIDFARSRLLVRTAMREAPSSWGQEGLQQDDR